MKNNYYVLIKKMLLVAFCCVYTISAYATENDPTLPTFQAEGSGGKVNWTYTEQVTYKTDSYEFQIEQQENGGAWTPVSPTSSVSVLVLTPDGDIQEDWSVNVGPLNDGSTYKFRVKLVKTSGSPASESGWATSSSGYTISILSGKLEIGELDKNDNSVTINVVDGVTGEDNIQIEYQVNGAGAWIAGPVFVLSTSESPKQVTGLAPNTQYRFRAKASKNGNFIYSNEINVKTFRTTPPNPDSFQAVTVCPEKIVVQAIYNNPSLFSEYEIKRNGVIVAFGPASQVITREIAVTPGSTSNIVITAKLPASEGGKFKNSNPISVFAPNYSMQAPTGTNVPESTVTETSGKVFWTPGVQDLFCLNGIIDYYDIKLEFLYQDGTTGSKTEFTYANATSYDITGIPAKTWVGVTIVPRNSTHGISAQGQQVWFRTLGPPDAPEILISGITTQVDALGITENVVAFTDNANDEDGFIFEYNVDGGDYMFLTSAKANSTMFVHKPLEGGNTICYRGKGVNKYGDGPYSKPACKRIDFTKEPNAPFNVTTSYSSTDKSITVKWQDYSYNEAGFSLSKSTDGTTFTQLATVDRNVTSYVDKDVVEGTSYWYSVRAGNDVGESDAVVSAKITVPTAAAGIVNVYPNPTVDFVNLKVAADSKSSKVTLVDQNNRKVLVKTLKLQAGEASLDLSNLTPGAYQMIIETDNQEQISRKIYKY